MVMAMKRDLSRLLTYTILNTCCTADFPPELSSILVRNAVTSSATFYSHGATLSSQSNGMQELHSLRALQSFMFCKQEMRAYDLLLGICGSGGWNGATNSSRGFSLPPLTMPHARRPEVSYHAHAISCLVNSAKAKEDINMNETLEDQKYGAAKTPQEEYSLLCRWDRGTTILTIGTWNLCHLLRGSICGAMEFMSTAASGVSRGNNSHWKNNQFTLAIDIGSSALSILTAALRMSPSTLTPSKMNEEEVETPNLALFDEIFHQIIQPIWSTLSVWNNSPYLLVQHLSSLDSSPPPATPAAASSPADPTSHHTREIYSIQLFATTLWRFIYDFCLCQREYCHWMVTKGMMNLIVANIGITSSVDFNVSSIESPINSNSSGWSLDSSSTSQLESISSLPLVWMLRCCRVCLSYHYGINQLLELFALLQHRHVGSRQELEAWIPSRWNNELKAELVMVLEEAALTCALSFISVIEIIQHTNLITVTSRDWNEVMKDQHDFDAILDLSRLIFQVSQAVTKWLFFKGKEGSLLGLRSFSVRECTPSELAYLAALYHFISTVFGCDHNISFAEPPVTVSQIVLSTFLRGPGLLHSAMKLGQTSIQLFDESTLIAFQNLSAEVPVMIQSLSLHSSEEEGGSPIFLFQLCLNALSSGLWKEEADDSVIGAYVISLAFGLKRLLFSSVSYALSVAKEEIHQNRIFLTTLHSHCHSPPLAPSVASGLFSLQSSRTRDSINLIHLQTLALFDQHDPAVTVAPSVASSYCLQILPNLLQSFPRLTRVLLWRCVSNILFSSGHQEMKMTQPSDRLLVRGIVNSILRSDEKLLSETSQTHEPPTRGGTRAITSLYEETPKFCGFCFLDAVSSNSSADPATAHLALPIFTSLSFVSESPLSGISEGIHPEWIYHCLKGLKGEYLTRWIHVLLLIQDTGGYQTRGTADYGKLMYWLCRVAVSDVTPEHTTDLAPSEDPLSCALEDYTELMKRAVSGLWNESVKRLQERSSSPSASFGSESHTPRLAYEEYGRSFCNEAGLASATGSLPSSQSTKVNTRVWEETNLSEVTDKISRAASVGLHDLVGRLIEATSTQSHHHSIHAISLLPLLLPGFLPWNERVIVWTEIGSRLRMLHLLESRDFMTQYLAVFLLPGLDSITLFSSSSSVRENGAVERAILESLLSIRNYDEEKSQMVVSIGLYSLCRFIFYDLLMIRSRSDVPSHTTAAPLLVEGVRGRLLLDLISRSRQVLGSNGDENCDKNSNARKVFLDVVKFYPAVERTELLLLSVAQRDEPSSSSVLETSGQIFSTWNGVQGESMAMTIEKLDWKEVLVAHRDRKGQESIGELLREFNPE
jgi:hypothetical protein